MFLSNTLFIVGAGASHEAEMPLGAELTEHIARLLDFHMDGGQQLVRGDHRIHLALRRLVDEQGWRENKFFSSGREIADAMQLALSIDTFLDSHRANREFVQLGKLGIARAISMAESESKFSRATVGVSHSRCARSVEPGITA